MLNYLLRAWFFWFSWSSLPHIRFLKNYVDKVNETLSRVESVRKFTILPKKLYEEDGEVTPTMKVERNHVNKAFKELIDAMYK